MMVVLLVAAVGLISAGLLAIGFGIPIKEFSTGNTLIIAGVIGFCTGAIMLALWTTVRELRNIARRLGAGLPEARGDAAAQELAAIPGLPDVEQPGAPGSLAPGAPPPWQNEAVLRDHPIPEPLHPEPPPAAAKPKRNLLFASTSRKERERSQPRPSEPLSPDLSSSELRSRPPSIPPVEPAEPPSGTLADAWPKAERTRPGEALRRGRTPPPVTETNGGPPRNEEQPEVTVLKSGVVDGMAYSLFSDGSIEAQMPEGMMRFASIDELRAHLDQRP
jgi:hypothetical protein